MTFDTSSTIPVSSVTHPVTTAHFSEPSIAVSERFLRLPAVISMVGIPRSTLYEKVASGSFPEPVRIGGRCIAWRLSSVTSWMNTRPVATYKAAA